MSSGEENFTRDGGGTEPEDFGSRASMLESVFETAADGMRLVDGDFNVIRVNRTFTKMAGVTKAEALGKKCHEIFGGSLCHTEDCLLKRIQNGAGRILVEMDKKRKDGSLIPCIVTASPFLNPDGQFMGIVEDYKDISERKSFETRLQAQNEELEILNEQLQANEAKLKAQAEELIERNLQLQQINEHLLSSETSLRLLSEKREDLERIVNTSQAVAFLWKAEPGWPVEFVSANIRSFGYEPDDFYSSRISYAAIVHPDDFARVTAEVQEFSGTGGRESFAQQYGIITGQGETRWLDARIWIRRNDKGAITHYQGLILDITRQKQVEDELRFSEDLFRRVIDASPNCIYAKDDSGRYLLANKSLCVLFGLDPEDVVGKTDCELSKVSSYTEAQAEQFHQADIKVITTKQQVHHLEEFFTMSDGEVRCFQSIKMPLALKDNQDCMLGVSIDITERKRAEREIREKNQELEDALTVKAEFLSMVSHELRSPLVPILGYSELLLEGALGKITPAMKKAIGVIMNRTEALASLIDDLLTLSRIEEGALRVAPTPVAVGEFMARVVDTYSRIDHGKQVSIGFSGADFKIMADANRLEQIVNNLINNAIKYSGESVDIEIMASISGDRGLIEVSDNGLGMSNDHIEFIFDRFYQVEQVDTRRHKGAGLGLAIVKELAELMNGEISVRSAPGKGSTFTLSMPLFQSRIEKPQSTDDRADVLLQGLGPLKILLIDDDMFIMNLVENMFGDRFTIAMAATGELGLEMAGKDSFDLVLLDWMMPGMDGIRVLKRLKADEATSRIPVCFLSGKVDPNSIKLALDSGAADFITKPFSKEKLSRYITRIASRA